MSFKIVKSKTFGDFPRFFFYWKNEIGYESIYCRRVISIYDFCLLYYHLGLYIFHCFSEAVVT